MPEIILQIEITCFRGRNKGKDSYDEITYYPAPSLLLLAPYVYSYGGRVLLNREGSSMWHSDRHYWRISELHIHANPGTPNRNKREALPLKELM